LTSNKKVHCNNMGGGGKQVVTKTKPTAGLGEGAAKVQGCEQTSKGKAVRHGRNSRTF